MISLATKLRFALAVDRLGWLWFVERSLITSAAEYIELFRIDKKTNNPPFSVRLFKRFADIWFGLLGSIAFIFVYPIIALLIKIDSKGPVFYCQECVGINRRTASKAYKYNGPERRRNDIGGKVFLINKLRTNSVGSENTESAENIESLFRNKANNSRITKIGSYLIRMHLNEAPAFFNVLNGTMSLIGPSPVRRSLFLFYSNQIPGYQYRNLGIRPGLINFSKVMLGHGESLDNVVRKSRYDIAYRTNLSTFSGYFKIDSQLLLRGIFSLFNPPKIMGGPYSRPAYKRSNKIHLYSNQKVAMSIVREAHLVDYIDYKYIAIEYKSISEIKLILKQNFSVLPKKFSLWVTHEGDISIRSFYEIIDLVEYLKVRGCSLNLKGISDQAYEILNETGIINNISIYRTSKIEYKKEYLIKQIPLDIVIAESNKYFKTE